MSNAFSKPVAAISDVPPMTEAQTSHQRRKASYTAVYKLLTRSMAQLKFAELIAEGVRALGEAHCRLYPGELQP